MSSCTWVQQFRLRGGYLCSKDGKPVACACACACLPSREIVFT